MPILNIVTLVKKNKFGCATHHINLDPFHRIKLHETTNGTYKIEILRLGVLWSTRLHSFTSDRPILDVISESMDRVAIYYRTSNKYNISEDKLIKEKKHALEEANRLFNLYK